MSLTGEARKIVALARRDMFQWLSYRSQMFTTLATAVLGIASWGFIATFRNVPIPEYNTDYVSFLMVGIIVSSGILPLSKGLQRRLNPWTLETILMTGVKPITFVVGIVSFTYLLAVALMIPQLALGIYIFGAVLNMNLLSLILAISISSIIIFSLAMISTGIRIVTKVSDPVSWAVTTAGSLFAGMLFPISHLDSFIPGFSTFSWILPHTWIFHIVRLSALSRGSLLDPQVALSFLGASVFAIVMFPIGLYVFKWGIRRAKRDGTLGWY